MDSANRFREKRRNREHLHVGQSLLGWHGNSVGRHDFRNVGLRAKARKRLACEETVRACNCDPFCPTTRSTIASGDCGAASDWLLLSADFTDIWWMAQVAA